MINEKPFMQRLTEAYEEQKYTYFVTDGEGNCMAENMTEIDARMYAMKHGWSIGRTEIEKLSDGEVLDLVYDYCEAQVMEHPILEGIITILKENE
jgi:hypothetical protein